MRGIRIRSIASLVPNLFLIVAIVLGGGAPVFAGDSESNRTTLRGLSGIYVLVESLGPETERARLTQAQLQTDVELRLRRAGIKVLTEQETLLTPAAAYLYVDITSFHAQRGYTLFVTVALRQAVILMRDPSIVTLAETWSVSWLGKGHPGSFVKDVREKIADAVDQFMNAYLAMNPKEQK